MVYANNNDIRFYTTTESSPSKFNTLIPDVTFKSMSDLSASGSPVDNVGTQVTLRSFLLFDCTLSVADVGLCFRV